MKYALSPKTFFVKEIFNPLLAENGKYYYYTLEKRIISHSQAVKKVPVRAYFSGIKDKNASTIQWFCTEEQIPEINEPDFKIKFKGCSNTRIHVGMHKGNSFKVTITLTVEEIKTLRQFNPKNELVGNYFGEQRFGERSINFCMALKANDFEDALKIFLTQGSKFDTPKSTSIKSIFKENWGNWEKIGANEQVLGTGKMILIDFLKANPTSFREAFSYAEPKSLQIMLKACQALRFNEELAKLAIEKKPNNIFNQISQLFPNYPMSASKAFTRKIEILPTEFEKKFRKGTLERRTFFYAEKFKVKKLLDGKAELCFNLSKGCYATVFLKFLESWLSKNQKR